MDIPIVFNSNQPWDSLQGKFFILQGCMCGFSWSQQLTEFVTLSLACNGNSTMILEEIMCPRHSWATMQLCIHSQDLAKCGRPNLWDLVGMFQSTVQLITNHYCNSWKSPGTYILRLWIGSLKSREVISKWSVEYILKYNLIPIFFSLRFTW